MLHCFLGMTVVTVVSGDNSMVYMLSGIDDEADRLDWINKFGNNGLSPLAHNHADVYLKARKYMLHACLRVEKQINDPPLTPIAGLQDRFRNIISRKDDNEYDTKPQLFLYSCKSRTHFR